MDFWIGSSIVLVIVIIVLCFGPVVGLYGDYVKEEKKGEAKS